MADLEAVRRVVATNQGLGTIAVPRPDGSVHATVVNGGVLGHPVGGHDVVGAVLRGDAHKLRLLRSAGRASFTFRDGWRWAGVEGPVDLIGPHDPLAGVDAERLRVLLREVFQAAGGTHEDYDEYDRVMRAEARTVVLISPERVLGNA